MSTYFSRPWHVLLLLSSLTLILLGGKFVSAQQADKTDASPNKTLRFRVVDKQGGPISGANVFASIVSAKVTRSDSATDADGIALVEIPEPLEILRTWISADGYVTLFASWEDGTEKNIPEEYQVLLQHGTELGGVVVDDQGNPIAGAKIEVTLKGGGQKQDSNLNSRINPWLAESDEPAVTDAEGKWNIRNAPAGDDLELSIGVSHSAYLSFEQVQPISKLGLNVTSLRNQTATITLSAGTRIRGRVVDSNDKPLADALVVRGDRPYWEAGSQEVKTDSMGEFQLPALNSEDLRLTVLAEGWMPQTRIVEIDEQSSVLQFKLQPGKKLHVLVVDQKGEPIPNVYFQILSWRGTEALYNTKHSNVVDSEIPGRSDEQGQYLWAWAPDDAVKFSLHVVENNVAIYQQQLDLIGDDSIQTVVLLPKFKLSGMVVDAVTGQSISDYSIAPITFTSEAENARGITQSGGFEQYSSPGFTMDSRVFEGVTQNQFRIESPGYRVYHTRRYSLTEPPQTLTIRLEPTSLQSGRVLDANGDAVLDAGVSMAKPMDSLHINRPEDYSSGQDHRFALDQAGRFYHATQSEPFVVVAANKDGYAEKYFAPGDEVGDMVLQPWASINGVLYQDGKPVPGASIVASPIRQLGGDNPHLQDSFWTLTDVDGSFSFTQLPPVPLTIGSILTSWEDYPITSNQVIPLDLRPGESRSVQLGGDGLRVTGSVRLIGEGADAIEFRYGIHQLVRTDGGEIDVPSHALNKLEFTAGIQREYDLKLAGSRGTLEGLESHIVKLNPDGTFLINGVRPGDYRFLLKMYEPPTGCLIDPVGYGYLEFSTSDYEVIENSIDLGVIEIKLNPIPQVGQMLANFSWRDTSGNLKTVEDFRGRYVVLDFWATWCGPCIKSMPDLARLNGEWSEQGIEVVGISVDADIEAAKAFVDENKFPWTQGFAGELTETPAGRLLGIGSVPTYILLDPEGKIIARSSSLDEIEQAAGALE